MMITIRGLPLKTKYQDVKVILKNECNISEFILDNLVNDESGMYRKVRVGLVEDSDGYEIIKCLNGLRMPGNCVLRVDIVGKPPASSPQGSNNFEPKSASNFSNEYRNNYSNQQTNDFRGRTNAPGFEGSYSATQSQFSGPVPSHGPSGSHAPVDSLGRPSPWGPSGTAANQWNQNQPMDSQNNYQQSGNPSYTQQYPSNTERTNTRPYLQGRADNNQGYGYSPKTNPHEGPRKPDTRTHVLRNVELVDTQPTNPPIQSGRYPPSQGFQQQKPITIMKDNFQGPSSYDIGSSNPSSSYQRHGQGSPQSWTPQSQQLKPHPYPKSNSGPYEKQYEDVRQHGMDKRVELQKNTQQPVRTDVYKDYEKSGQRYSPHRAIVPGGRQFSPSRRLMSPSRQMRPARAGSPSNPLPSGRRDSPSGRPSPTRRLISPANRMMATMDRRPGGPPPELSQCHQLSPHERSERINIPRYSPQRHRPDKPIDKIMDPEALKSSKHRSGYDAPTQAPNQPIYSGGFRTNVHENDPFPRNNRQFEQDVPWQQDGEQMYAIMKKRDEDGLATSHQNMYGDKRSPRKSRSPIRRDRSPLRDRYRRHSPSSSSPRRSWAFEKRRSPEVHEAPPPPNWPEREHRDDMRFKSVSDRKEDNLKHVPVWDKHPSAKLDDGKRRKEKPESRVGSSKIPGVDFVNKMNVPRDELFAKHQRDPKFDAKREFEDRGGYHHTDDSDRKPYFNKQDTEYRYPAERDNARRLGEARRKESPNRGEGKNKEFKTMNKDTESMYNRAQEFKKKAEDLRKPERGVEARFEERGRTTRVMDERDFGVSSRPIDDTHRHHINDSPRRRVDSSPRRRMDGSPRRRVDGSPRRRMDDSPRHPMDGAPRRRMDGSPRHIHTDGSPRRRMGGSPRRNMEVSSRRRTDDSPHHRTNDSVRRGIDASPHHSHPEAEHRRRNELNTKASPSKETAWKLPPQIKTKIIKAAEEISNKLLKLYSNKPIIRKLNGEGKSRVLEELRKSVSHKITELFDIEEISFIELVIKFHSRLSDEDKDKMFEDIIESLPARFRNRTTLGSDPSKVPHKRPKFSKDHNLKEESSDVPYKKAKRFTEDNTKEEATDSQKSQGGIYIPDWKPNVDPPKEQVSTMQLMPTQLHMPYSGTGQVGIQQLPPPQLVLPTLATSVQWTIASSQFDNNATLQADNFSFIQPTEGVYELFLCQDNFDSITAFQGELLKNFIVSQIVKVTEHLHGWAPDFTFRGLQSMRRYVVSTRDQSSKEWLMRLDFSGFVFFNVLVYTKEELWYERAAIWLPGHSKYSNREPLEKLKLQNKKLEGVNIGKWKMVKKIITLIGTRLYVDMPPSSARALEKHNMQLSYELQKVNVFLKAVAVDKDAFDTGLKEKSTINESALDNVAQNYTMPAIQNGPSVLKLALSGQRDMSLEQARQIKETLIYHIYKYHSAEGISRTDFVKYGFISPHYFGVVPENTETKRWLMNRFLGKLNHRSIIVISGEEDTIKYIRMTVTVPNEQNITALSILDNLKQSNQGVKGINFELWRLIKLRLCADKKSVQLYVDVDLQSVETVIEMDYELDYMNASNKVLTVCIESQLSEEKLLETIKEMKRQSSDNYDVANMDLDSESDDDDVICIS